MGVGHYENFPVASWLCPAALREPIRSIYRFARVADDLADEGEAQPEERRAALAAYRAALHDAAAGTFGLHRPDVFGPLAATIAAHRLPLGLLEALLDAFTQDTWGAGYPTRRDLLDYCSRSANPIGRLLLHLYGWDDESALAQSDALCTALQLINFWQDPSVDLARGRCCFPHEDLRRHGLDPATLEAGHDTPATQAMVAELSLWARETLAAGAPLAVRLPGRIGWELRLVVQGGQRVLERIAELQWRTLSQRPRLGTSDWLRAAWRTALMRVGPPPALDRLAA